LFRLNLRIRNADRGSVCKMASSADCRFGVQIFGSGLDSGLLSRSHP
jgi:hypothetical protein